ncbi:MAG: dihydropyrimidinase [Candidatus Riflebacteria bacterium]|nr:dihydropyrimidinase [Candidatus Riflebacteria bacterium]
MAPIRTARTKPVAAPAAGRPTGLPRYTLIRRGTIHTAADSFPADLLIEKGKIVQIGDVPPGPGMLIIDAKGLEIFPGGIDVHTHFELPFMGTVSADDFETGTVAAACGGTTAIVDFVIPGKGQRITEAAKAWHKKAAGKAVVDYGFHIALVEATPQVLADIPKVVADGITSFKCFMAYKGSLMIDDTQLLAVLAAARRHGALVSVHAENGDMLSWVMEQLVAAKKTSPRYHPVAHPALAEGEAAHRAIALAAMAEAPLYIVHLSCMEALDEVVAARMAGQPVFAETCPQYLLLDDRLYEKPGFEGAKWVMSPPLRHVSNQVPLWSGLREGFLQCVATDHCSFRFKGQKDMGKGNFLRIPNGIPAVGDRMNLLYSHGVRKGRLSPQQFAAITATNPARLFGMYPDKGTIAVGSDADLVLYDPKKTGVVSAKTTRHNVDYSAFEGFRLNGLPVLVLSRGEVIARDGDYVGGKGRGRYLARRPFDLAHWGYR